MKKKTSAKKTKAPAKKAVAKKAAPKKVAPKKAAPAKAAPKKPAVKPEALHSGVHLPPVKHVQPAYSAMHSRDWAGRPPPRKIVK